MLVEPILGRGGCVVPPAAFLPALRALADEAGALLVADEIWTGHGPHRRDARVRRAGVVPDVRLPRQRARRRAADLGVRRTRARDGGVGRARRRDDPHGHALRLAARVRRGARDARRDQRRGELASARDEVGERGARRARATACGERADGARPRPDGRHRRSPTRAEALAVARALLARGYIVLTGGVRGDALTLSPPLTIAPELLSAFAAALGDVVRAQ